MLEITLGLCSNVDFLIWLAQIGNDLLTTEIIIKMKQLTVTQIKKTGDQV